MVKIGKRLTDALRPYVEVGDLPGVVALSARGADIAVVALGDRSAGAPMTPDTLFRLASLTKPIVAAAALTLVDDGTLELHAPVDSWLPELAGRPVLRRLDGALDDVVPQRRPITVRDVLTYTMGFGVVPAPAGSLPIQRRVAELGLEADIDPEPISLDEWLRRLGTLPMLHQPGEGWAYHSSGDVLAVLLTRVCGQDLSTVLRERLFEPLGMRDTGFRVSEPERLAQRYRPGSGGLEVVIEPAGRWQPPLRESGATGLVSTAADLLTFGRMLLSGGAEVLSPHLVAAMMRDQLTAKEKEGALSLPRFGVDLSWGFGGAVVLADDPDGPAVGSYGWTGGTGTAFSVDPAGRVNVLLTQRELTSPRPWEDAFWREVRGVASA